ncbi:MAG: magnesium transporter, partial [Bdellovibrionales bacterium]|nr:magnesium transporter [Bdellovibrionales bacterium]
AMTPLILAVSETIGNQSSALALGALRSGRVSIFQMGSHMLEEAEVNLILGAGFGGLLTLLMLLVTRSGSTSISLGLILFIQLLLAATLGNLIPLLLSKMQIDPAARTISVLTVVSNIFSILFLYGLVLKQFGERVVASING